MPEIDSEDLNKKAKKNPKSKNYNNANSRKNLRQYAALTPEIVSESDEELDAQVHSLVVGRKLDPVLVKKLMPERGVLTGAEKKRYLGIVQQFLGDFKNEEPTAADLDDIFEIAESDIMKTRLYRAAKDNPDAIININQSIERIYKRKQSAKENLSARRIDRKDARSSQDINIVDLVVRFDLEQQRRDADRVDALLAEEEAMGEKLRKVIEEDG